MYNMLSIQDIVDINKQFDQGKLVNKGSLEFALSSIKNTKDWITQLAYLVRSISLDHVFEEGNKRTAAALIIGYVEVHKKGYDSTKVDKIVTTVIQKRIQDIKTIRRMIKHAIW